MNQEGYMDLHALKNGGWTNKEISEELGVQRGVHPELRDPE